MQGGHPPPKRKRVPVSRRRREARRRKLRNPVIPPNTIRIRLSGSRITKVPCMAEERKEDSGQRSVMSILQLVNKHFLSTSCGPAPKCWGQGN